MSDKVYTLIADMEDGEVMFYLVDHTVMLEVEKQCMSLYSAYIYRNAKPWEYSGKQPVRIVDVIDITRWRERCLKSVEGVV